MKRFNVAKEERKLNRKNNLANKIKIRTIILSIFVLVGSIMLFTYSKYSTSVNLEIMHSKSNTCHNSTATADCAKEGNGFARITYLGN